MKTNILSLLTIAFLLFSCSSDDDNNNNTTAEIPGTWRLTSFLIESAIDLNNDGSASNDLIQETNCYQNETLVFNADGNMAANSTSFLEMEGVIDATSGDLVITTDCVPDAFSESGTWTQNGASVTILVDGTPIVAVVSGNALTFQIPAGYQIPTNDNGTIVTVLENTTFVYTKQ